MQRYNDRQTRSERKITDYYNHICKDKKKHPVYEMIIGIYGKSEDGTSICNPEQGKAIMMEFVQTWKERNPNLELIGAYYHADEEGEPHVHLDYIPVAHGYKNGLDTQNGLVKSLGEQGFVKSGKDTAQIQWQKRENDYLTQLCENIGLTVHHPRIENIQHLDTQMYKTQRKLKNAEEQLKKLQGRVLKQREVNAINGKKSFTGALKNVTYEEYLSLKKTAKKVDSVIKTNKKLEQSNKELSAEIELNNNRLEQAKTLLKQHGVQVSNNDLDSLIEKQKYRFDIEDIKKYKPRTLKKENEHDIQKTKHFSIDD